MAGRFLILALSLGATHVVGGYSAPPSPSNSQPVDYVVGDALGWTIPAIAGANPNAYQLWAANKPFKVGDTLVFNYIAGRQTVTRVNKAAYISRDTRLDLWSIYESPPTFITLNFPGEYFFISSYPNHCADGQKLAINATGHAASFPTTSSIGSPTSSITSSTTPPSSTPSSTTPSSSTSPTGSPTSSILSSNAPSSHSTSTGFFLFPPGNSASSFGILSISATLFSIFVVLFFV